MLVYTHCLSIAGSDPSGGAGIQADIKVFSALGCYASAAITSLTVQNTIGVKTAYDVAPEVVAAQVEAVIEDRIPDAIKIGMTGNAENVHAIAAVIRRLPHRPFIILDPIMLSSSGHQLLDDEGITAIMTDLAPLCDLMTPNIPEFSRLCCDKTATTKSGLGAMAATLFDKIPNLPYIFVKGGHLDTVPTDTLISRAGKMADIEGAWVETHNTHGTGCALSSSIAAYMAKHHTAHLPHSTGSMPQGAAIPRAEYTFDDLLASCTSAKKYLTKALSCGAEVQNGRGKGAMNHLFSPEKLCISNI